MTSGLYSVLYTIVPKFRFCVNNESQISRKIFCRPTCGWKTELPDRQSISRAIHQAMKWNDKIDDEIESMMKSMMKWRNDEIDDEME